jgi:hypothetical protein
MTQADSVLSTPRKPAPKIKPTAPVDAFDDASRNKVLARGFVSLEPDICDLDRLVRLCLRLSDDGPEAEEFLTLCLLRLQEVSGEFRKQYYALYKGRHQASTSSKAVA